MKAVLVAAALVVAVPLSVAAQQNSKPSDKSKTQAKGKKSPAVKPANNANCPVGGAPVGSMQEGSHIVYKGYKVGLCCDGCKNKFNSDPDAYLNKALGR